ncbi:bifunctional chorismate mutase/prephenate dehydrogenase [Pleionea mediterranea]|uniref:chorismate mutase n=1 Tax=Pleionea mediterranea TaxID=523701 RepID=A0A316FRH9_9GAMM|nr:bifunctional chorismate mutase/prephenate dehydrogenase [Pleionea mediterranea]PWK50782.1 chorismate mutase/prephenate dehydrogenase [Pleionea mediterranea]
MKNDRQQLEQLRQSIDECDEALLALLKKRQGFVEQLVAHKQAAGDAVFVPEREQAIFQRLTDRADFYGLDFELVRDILQRIMRDSYARQARIQRHISPQNQDHQPATQPHQQPQSAKSICVIGGKGQLGGFFVEQFRLSGHSVCVLDRNDWPNADQLLANKDLVLIAVPMAETETTIEQLSGLSDHTLLADITSVKHQPLQHMLKVHSGPVIGLHPMFGPGQSHMARQLLLYTQGRQPEASDWLLQQFRQWGCYTESIDAEAHDTLMGTVQALRHFVTFVTGWQLMANGQSLDELLRVSSPIYRLELSLIGRLFAQQPELYVDIWLKSEQAPSVISAFGDCFKQAEGWINKGERTQLINQFKQIADYFSHSNADFFQQSDTLLEAFRERIQSS